MNKNNFRDLMYKWVTIKDYKKYPDLKSSLDGYQGEHLVGFIYIDHHVGLTLDCYKLFDVNDDDDNSINLYTGLYEEESIDRNRVLIRYSNFINYDFEIIPNSELSKYKVPENHENLLLMYTDDILEKLRENINLDQFRSNSHPDDIKITLMPNKYGMKGEIIWGRLENIKEDSEQEIFECIVLNKPYQDFKISLGESVEVVEASLGETPIMVCSTSMDRMRNSD